MTMNNLEIPLDQPTAKAFSKMSASKVKLAVKELSQVARLFVYAHTPEKNKAERIAEMKRVFGETTKYAKKAGITQKDIDEASL